MIARSARAAAGFAAAALLLAHAAMAQVPAGQWIVGDSAGLAARMMVTLLHAADADGLRPADYEVARLDSLLAAGADPQTARTLDAALSAAATRFLDDLRGGRTASPLGPRRDGWEAGTALTAAIRGDSLEQLIRAVRPPFAQYAALAAALIRYRALPPLAMPDLGRLPLRPGGAVAGAGALRRLLMALGDLPPTAAARPIAAPDTTYDDALVTGIRRFQARHALEPDGVIGPATAAALGTPASRRIAQLELAMERLRWLPRITGEPLLVVNVPAFELVTLDSGRAAGAPALRMRIIVGDAPRRPTPMLASRVTRIEFRPYWNVPPSILRQELLPRLRRSPDYLRSNQMEIVGPGDTVLGDAATPALVAALAHGAARVRQRPGEGNALGLVKVVFPNRSNVYLHGTPAPELFLRAQRDLSHGCIRVEEPAALATWVLQGEPAWTRARVDSAIAGPTGSRVALTHPMPAFVFYTTAVVHADGTVHFHPDVYGEDRRAMAALRAVSR